MSINIQSFTTRVTIPGMLAFLAASAASFGDVTFGLPTNLATAQRPSGAAIANFTGDGLGDVAVTVDAQDRLLVFPGTTSGVSPAPLTTLLPNGGGAGSLASADFDGDGDVDLAVAEQNTASVLILTNTAGSFTIGATVPVGANPRGMKAGDLNGDGRSDLVVANRDGNSATVMLNTAGGWSTVALATGLEPRDVALGDLNGDGDLDLAVSNHDSRSVSVFSNNGAGAFSLAQTLPVNAVFRPDGIIIAQLNGQPLPEVAAIISDDVVGSFVAVYANTAGTLSAGATNFATLGANSGSVVGADFDRDGDTDLAVANEDSANISVLTNLGTGLGAAVLFAAGAHPTAIAAGNIGAGTMSDLAVPNRDANTTSVFFNTATPPSGCDSIDFNHDSLFPDVQDIGDFITVFAGGACAPPNPSACNTDIDFNNDTLFPDVLDIESFLSVFAGGPCL